MERLHGYHVPLDQYVQVPEPGVENWIGYFLPETQTPEAAFGSYLDELYYIQHKDWAMARTMPKRGSPWIVLGGVGIPNPSLIWRYGHSKEVWSAQYWTVPMVKGFACPKVCS